MPTYDRVHLASCLADAVRSAVENLRDDPAVSHLMFHTVINGGEYNGYSLYSLAYSYLEDGLVRCTCGAIPTRQQFTGRTVPPSATPSTEPTHYVVGDNAALPFGSGVWYYDHDDFSNVSLYTQGGVDDEIAIDDDDLVTADVWRRIKDSMACATPSTEPVHEPLVEGERAPSVRELFRAAYLLLGDGQGGEWDDNAEYTRGIIELLADTCGVGLHPADDRAQIEGLIRLAGGE